MTSDFYPKKFGLIKRKITHEAPSNAIPITTLIIIFFPPDGLPVAIIIPPMIIRTNETIRIRVINILIKLHINTGNAVCQVTPVSSLSPTSSGLFSIQLPINGILVLSDIPQQTHGALQDTQPVPIDLYHHVHSQILSVLLK